MPDSDTELDHEQEGLLATVDAYEVADVAVALRAFDWSDKARVMVKALASAPDRALSRLALARLTGSNNVNSTNSVLGNFCKALALALDTDLMDQWKPAGGGGGDWVMFACLLVANPSPIEGDTDDWVFVMRPNFAQGLETIGFVPFLASVHDETLDDDEEESEDDDDDLPTTPLDEIEAAETDGEFDDLTPTEREAVINARMGQGAFRAALVERWSGACAVTGAAVEAALVASHIKPWGSGSHVERLDPANGLLLVGTLDRLFDVGLISFDASGTIMLSPRLPVEQYRALHLTPGQKLRMLPADTAKYLAYHRTTCFWESEDDCDDDDAE